MKRCSQNSQLNGLSPVCVLLCLSRLAAVNGETGRVAGQKHSLCTPSQGLPGWPEQHKQLAACSS